MSNFIVITSIQDKTDAVRMFEALPGWHTIVVGDQKTPPVSSSPGLTYLSVEDQLGLDFELSPLAPVNHYARKNIGYLFAIKSGAEIIYDTDDDNAPGPNWSAPPFQCAREARSDERFINAYRLFTQEMIWPRGYPLDLVLHHSALEAADTDRAEIGVWQGLVDGDPDVDAIYRLVIGEEVVFNRGQPLFLRAHRYCPFNSQNTFWQRRAFPFLYLPATTSFRFTDILRGYIAQPLLWAIGLSLGFLPAAVVQRRNPHDLMADFAQELDCYLNIGSIVDLLESQDWSNTPEVNLITAYTILAESGHVSQDELAICKAWISDLARLSTQV